MPGLASHVLIADEIADSIAPSDGIELFTLVNNERSHFLMGALAPDIFFFAPDFGDEPAHLLRIMSSFYDKVISPIERFYNDAIRPVEQDLETAVTAADQEALCGLIGTVKDEIDLLQNGLVELGSTAIAGLMTDAVNIFDKMIPPIQHGFSPTGNEPGQGWYWFDMIHYLSTGRFIMSLWNLANTAAKKAFVLGWTTHYASDTIGHQTVNALVGGPYRSHNQRHHFIENLLDVRLFDEFRDQEFISSRAHIQPRPLPYAEEVEAALPTSTIFDRPNDVPPDLESIFQMVVDAMHETYTSPPQRLTSRYLDVQQLNGAYFYTLMAIKISTSQELMPPRVPAAEVVDEINDMMQEFLDDVSDPPRPSADPPDFSFSLWDPAGPFDVDTLQEWLDYLWDTITYLSELMSWLGARLHAFAHMIGCPLTAPVKLQIRSMLWPLHSAAHQITTSLREALVLAAVVAPDREWLATHPIAQLSLDVSANPAATAEEYPRQGRGVNDGFLAYPGTPVESPATIAAPEELWMETTAFVDAVTEDEDLYEDLAESSSPDMTRDIEFANQTTAFASARSMSLRIMKGLAATPDGAPYEPNIKKLLADWNLDADRGYGYLHWTYEGIGDQPPPWYGPAAEVNDEWASP